MDELELLKKDWQKSNTAFEKKSAGDLYCMLHKKSSNIVKTLFYISIAELIFWVLINTLPMVMSDNYKQKLDSMYEDSLFIGITIFTYVVIVAFVYLLFKSYKSISVTDNAKTLMKNILKTRKVVKYYVVYNLIMVCLSIATLIFALVIWLFYKLLYGILLKRLNRNYKELKKIEV